MIDKHQVTIFYTAPTAIRAQRRDEVGGPALDHLAQPALPGLLDRVEQRALLVGHAEIHASSFAAMRGVPRAGLRSRHAIDTMRGSLYR